MVKTLPSNIGGMDSILGWGAEIPMPEPKTKTKTRSNLVKKNLKSILKNGPRVKGKNLYC